MTKPFSHDAPVASDTFIARARECPDCGAPVAATRVFGFACRHPRCPMFDPPVASADSWPVRRPPSLARTIIRANLEAQAKKAVIEMIKGRALIYLRDPLMLDMIRPGFLASGMTPAQLITFAKEVLAQEMLNRARLRFVPVILINAKAAIIAGRYARAKERRGA